MTTTLHRRLLLGSWLLVLVAAHHHVIYPPPDDEPIPCKDSEWTRCGSERYCAPLDHDNGYYYTSTYCLHKTFLPLQFRDVVALLTAWSCCFVAAMAGIGGGGLVLPLVVLVLNFTPKEASVISNLAVLGNCIGQGVVNYSRSRQQQGATSMVLGTVLMVFPGLIAGGAGAIALEGVVPSTAILILAFLTLCLASVKTFRKANKLRQEEKTGIGNITSSIPAVESTTSLSYESCNSHEEDDSFVDQQQQQEVSARAGSVSGNFCKNHMISILIVSCWLLSVLTFLILRGSLWLQVPKCSPEYFCLVFTPAVMAVFFTWRGKMELRKQDETMDFSFHEGGGDLFLRTPLVTRQSSADLVEGFTQEDDPVLEVESQNGLPIYESKPEFDNLVWWLPFASAVIGLLSALLGIGGGELLGPTLLLLNMDPRYSSTTTAVLSLLNSGTNAIHHYLAGMMVAPAYGVAFWCAGLLGGGPGRSLAIRIAGGRTSVIAFSLFFVLLVGAGLVLYELLSTAPSWDSEGWC